MTFCANFLKRKIEQELVSLEREICADHVALWPVVDADFRNFAEIVHKRKDEFHKLGKSSLEACLNAQHSRSDKDLTFCFNFLKRLQNKNRSYLVWKQRFVL